MSVQSTSFALLMVALAAACGSSRVDFEPGDGGSLGGGGGLVDGGGGPDGFGGEPDAADAADEGPCQKMDIVFVVDDSKSMEEEQSNLAQNFPQFVQTLNEFTTEGGAQLDWRVAVTTTGRDVKYKVQTPALPGFPSQTIPFNEPGDNGEFRDKSSCGATRRWVERNDANAAQTFACLAKVGTSGPGFEMPLETLKLALDDRMADGTNAGFLRDDALLAVVILTDEDDCSRTDNDFTVTVQDGACEGGKAVADYVAAYNTIARGPGRWATAVIAGETRCTSNFGDAVEAKRLKELVQLAGANGKFSSICNGDLTTSLQEALSTFDAACNAFPPPVVN